MGWMAGSDTAYILEEKMKFDTVEQAMAACERNGMS
jgi:hypothetical protein